MPTGTPNQKAEGFQSNALANVLLTDPLPAPSHVFSNHHRHKFPLLVIPAKPQAGVSYSVFRTPPMPAIPLGSPLKEHFSSYLGSSVSMTLTKLAFHSLPPFVQLGKENQLNEKITRGDQTSLIIKKGLLSSSLHLQFASICLVLPLVEPLMHAPRFQSQILEGSPYAQSAFVPYVNPFIDGLTVNIVSDLGTRACLERKFSEVE